MGITNDGYNLIMQEIFRAKYGISVKAKMKDIRKHHSDKYYVEYGPENPDFCKLLKIFNKKYY